MTDDLLALRSCASWEAAHERAQFYIQTAHSQNPALAAEIPHVGAVVAYEKGAKGLLPPFMAFNQSSLQGATFLGGNYMPMMPPATRTGIATLTHPYFGTASQQRFEDRFTKLAARSVEMIRDRRLWNRELLREVAIRNLPIVRKIVRVEDRELQ